MKSLIKLAAIHSDYVRFPEEANPNSIKFDSGAPLKFIGSNIEKTLAFLHEAGRQKVDLVCTHEDFPGSCMYVRDLYRHEMFTSLAEEIPGPTSQRLGQIARQYGMYIAANYYEKDGNNIYNTSFLLDRNGDLTGKYRKVHPADGERWRVIGGREYPVFETDIGKIGFAICYDLIFPEHCRSLTMNGADIIIHQTQGWGIGAFTETGEAMIRTRAAENSVYMIVAKNIQPGDGGKSFVIDNYGKILAEAPGSDEKVISAEFIPDFNLDDEYNFDNFFAGVTSTKARQILAREPQCYSAITNVNPPLLERYKGIKLDASYEKANEILKKWDETDSTERSKYHW